MCAEPIFADINQISAQTYGVDTHLVVVRPENTADIRLVIFIQTSCVDRFAVLVGRCGFREFPYLLETLTIFVRPEDHASAILFQSYEPSSLVQPDIRDTFE